MASLLSQSVVCTILKACPHAPLVVPLKKHIWKAILYSHIGLMTNFSWAHIFLCQASTLKGIWFEPVSVDYLSFPNSEWCFRAVPSNT